MYGHITFLSPERQAKRQQLTEICKRLGESATTDQIREECYRVGFGKVSPNMLVVVRNELWPNRKKKVSNHCDGRVFTAEMYKDGELISGLFDFISCPKCKSQKTRVKWTQQIDGENVKRKKQCKDCNHVWDLIEEKNATLFNKRRQAHIEATHKRCTRCKQIKHVNDFRLVANDAHLRRASCTSCQNSHRQKSYYKKDIFNKYGITIDDYNAMLAQQNGKCKVCGSDNSVGNRRMTMPLCIDHCHITGKVRGLLCSKCNMGIGNFDDSVERLEAAVSYLNQFKEGI